MSRLTRLREQMAAQGVDVLALGPGAHMKWVVGFAPHPDERPCLLMITQTDAGFVMPALNAAEVRKSSDLKQWCWADSDGPMGAIAQAIQTLGIAANARLMVDQAMRTDFTLKLMEALPEARVTSAFHVMNSLRMIKEEDEIRQMKAQALLADAAIVQARKAAKVGASETEIATVIKDFFAKNGATTEFCIVANAQNAAFPHHHTGADSITANEAFLLDIGCRTGLYSSDITRMQALGPVSEEYTKVHAIVEEAVQAALATAKPGVKASAVDRAARDVITKAGYGEYFVHRTGHGMGLEGHEAPDISASNDTILQEGMVFSIEPGIYMPAKFGIRLEDIVVMRQNGPEILSELPRDLEQL